MHAATRPWMTVIALAPEGLAAALGRLRTEYGIKRISAVGGRSTATHLIDAGVVQDVLLTTTSRGGGQPDTPFYVGPHTLERNVVATKVLRHDALPIRVEHFALGPHRENGHQNRPNSNSA
jgi:hypothetical protein